MKILPNEFCSLRPKLQDSGNQALTLIYRGRIGRKMQFTELHPCSRKRNKKGRWWTNCQSWQSLPDSSSECHLRKWHQLDVSFSPTQCFSKIIYKMAWVQSGQLFSVSNFFSKKFWILWGLPLLTEQTACILVSKSFAQQAELKVYGPGAFHWVTQAGDLWKGYSKWSNEVI